MLTTFALIIAVLAACAGLALAWGGVRWQRATVQLRSRLDAARKPAMPVSHVTHTTHTTHTTQATYDAREIENLPSPVRRYFAAVLQDRQPIIGGVRLSQTGQFRPSEHAKTWRPFEATQVFTTAPPGFDWDARISIAPGLTAFVHDAYVAGEGILHAEAFGLVTVADTRGTPEAAQGELLRYLAEALWFPTALLPSQGVRWVAGDDSTASATLSDGATTVSLQFCFDSEGLIASFHAASRCRGVNEGVAEFAPWQGRFWSYEIRDGIRIPLEGEVAWQMPAGIFAYCRVRIQDIEYAFTRPA